MAIPIIHAGKSKLKDVVNKVHRRDWLLPKFQRPLVWLESADEPHPMVELIDSVMKGIPIGAILIAEELPKNEIETRPFEGSAKKEAELAEVNNKITVVLDGQQRLTTLLWALYESEDKDGELFVDLLRLGEIIQELWDNELLDDEKIEEYLAEEVDYTDFVSFSRNKRKPNFGESKLCLLMADPEEFMGALRSWHRQLPESEKLEVLEKAFSKEDTERASSAYKLVSKTIRKISEMFNNYEVSVISIRPISFSKPLQVEDIAVIYERINRLGVELTGIDLARAMFYFKSEDGKNITLDELILSSPLWAEYEGYAEKVTIPYRDLISGEQFKTIDLRDLSKPSNVQPRVKEFNVLSTLALGKYLTNKGDLNLPKRRGKRRGISDDSKTVFHLLKQLMNKGRLTRDEWRAAESCVRTSVKWFFGVLKNPNFAFYGSDKTLHAISLPLYLLLQEGNGLSQLDESLEQVKGVIFNGVALAPERFKGKKVLTEEVVLTLKKLISREMTPTNALRELAGVNVHNRKDLESRLKESFIRNPEAAEAINWFVAYRDFYDFEDKKPIFLIALESRKKIHRDHLIPKARAEDLYKKLSSEDIPAAEILAKVAVGKRTNLSKSSDSFYDFLQKYLKRGWTETEINENLRRAFLPEMARWGEELRYASEESLRKLVTYRAEETAKWLASLLFPD